MPFCCLRTKGAFLTEEYSLCTLPCLSVVSYWNKRSPAPGRLVLGNSRNDLPSAAAEAIQVAKLLNTEPLLGENILRGIVESQIARCVFVHVAGHAVSNASVPGFSGFYLADGTLLSATDLSVLQLNCKLAFLSGCKTGFVSSRFEDDPVSIGSGLLHAGASSVVFSLWEINDFVTNELVTSFYRKMLDGFSLNVCLREAQLKILRRSRYSHPYFWGAFQLMGDWAPLVSKNGELHFG